MSWTIPRRGAGAAVRRARRCDERAVGRRDRGTLRRRALDEIYAHARKLVADGRGKELMLMPGWWYVITAESFLDRLTAVPDVLALAPRGEVSRSLHPRRQGESGPLPGGDFVERASAPCCREGHPGLRSLLQRQGRRGRERRHELAPEDIGDRAAAVASRDPLALRILSVADRPRRAVDQTSLMCGSSSPMGDSVLFLLRPEPVTDVVSYERRGKTSPAG